jgi:hypothetical protein
MDPTKEKALLGPPTVDWPTVDQTELQYRYTIRYCTTAGRVRGFQNLPEHGATNVKAFDLNDVEEVIQTATTAPTSITLAGNKPKPQSDSPYRP